MSESVKALLVVIAIAAIVYRLAATQLSGHVIAKADYRRRAAVWFGVTVAVFVAHDYWIFALVAGALLAFGAAKDRNPLAFYCTLLCAVPPFGSAISGFGVLNYFFELNYLRLLGLTVLLPAAWRLFTSRQQRLPGPKLPDVLLLGYLFLLFALTLTAVPFTTALRQAFYLFIDIWLVYYVASRSVRDVESFREVAAAFILGAVIMAVIALFEAARGWLLYSSLESTLGVVWGYGSYMARGLGGPLRVMASTGHAIVFGYLMVVTIPLLVYLRPTIRSKFFWRSSLFVSVGALLATFSRGPWVGAIAMALVVAALGAGALKRVGAFGLAMVAAGGLAMLSEWGRTVLDSLPFIGTVGSSTVEYRQRLFEVSLNILLQSPIFGASNFYGNASAQELSYGGLIDMVNSYMGVALSTGVVGLSLFVGLFATAIVLAWRTRRHGMQLAQASSLANTLLAVLAGIMVTIATTSSVNIIQPIYFLVIGLAVGSCGRSFAHGHDPGAADLASGVGMMGGRLQADPG